MSGPARKAPFHLYVFDEYVAANLAAGRADLVRRVALRRPKVGELIGIRVPWRIDTYYRDEVKVVYSAAGVRIADAQHGFEDRIFRGIDVDRIVAKYATTEWTTRKWWPARNLSGWAIPVFLRVTATAYRPLQSVTPDEARREGVVVWEDGLIATRIEAYAAWWDRQQPNNEGFARWAKNPTTDVLTVVRATPAEEDVARAALLANSEWRKRRAA